MVCCQSKLKTSAICAILITVYNGPNALINVYFCQKKPLLRPINPRKCKIGLFLLGGFHQKIAKTVASDQKRVVKTQIQ